MDIFKQMLLHSHTSREAYQKLAALTNGFTHGATLHDMVRFQRREIFDETSEVGDKLVDMLVQCKSFPFTDFDLVKLIRMRDPNILKYLHQHNILGSIYSTLTFEQQLFESNDIDYLISTATDKSVLHSYIYNSIRIALTIDPVLNGLYCNIPGSTVATNIMNIVINAIDAEFADAGISIRCDMAVSSNVNWQSAIIYYIRDLAIDTSGYHQLTEVQLVDYTIDLILLAIHNGVVEYYVDGKIDAPYEEVANFISAYILLVL